VKTACRRIFTGTHYEFCPTLFWGSVPGQALAKGMPSIYLSPKSVPYPIHSQRKTQKKCKKLKAAKRKKESAFYALPTP
jgi:hypothetical protein